MTLCPDVSSVCHTSQLLTKTKIMMKQTGRRQSTSSTGTFFIPGINGMARCLRTEEDDETNCGVALNRSTSSRSLYSTSTASTSLSSFKTLESQEQLEEQQMRQRKLRRRRRRRKGNTTPVARKQAFYIPGITSSSVCFTQMMEDLEEESQPECDDWTLPHSISANSLSASTISSVSFASRQGY